MRTVGRAARVVVAVWIGAGLAGASPAFADVLVFLNGRTLSVRAHSTDGDLITVALLRGGEATFDRAIVARIDPETIPEAESGARQDTAESTAPVVRRQGAGPRPFAALIDQAADRHGVDRRLVHAVVEAESNYQPRARSPKGARGLMQVLPSTGAALGARNLYDPSSNLDAGVRYLKGLLSEFELPEALAAYNAGPATVRRFGGIPPIPETQRYVERVLKGFSQ
jgi:soluble lytic murein transglycosylase-like protein